MPPPAHGRGKQPKPLELRPGDRVLVGAPRHSTPGEWLLATVLWADREEFVSEHSPGGTGTASDRHRQVLPIEYVRAVGSIPFLVDFQTRCRAQVGDKARLVGEAEAALGRARDAVWAEVDKIAGDVPVERLQQRAISEQMKTALAQEEGMQP